MQDKINQDYIYTGCIFDEMNICWFKLYNFFYRIHYLL
jgi:hypothetical protein